MNRSRMVVSLICMFTVVMEVSCRAQAVSRVEPDGSHLLQVVRKSVEPRPETIPSISHHPNSLEFLPQNDLSSQDAKVVRSAWLALQKNASIEGFDLLQHHWEYQQAVCPVFPQHILLLFTQKDGRSGSSMFSAVLFRNAPYSVRIVPILRRGVSPYSGSVDNPETIAVFNWLRGQKDSIKNPDWVAMGMCFAALAGTHVVLPLHGLIQDQGPAALAAAPSMQVAVSGASVLRFPDVEFVRQPREWEMSFDSEGHLVKASAKPFAAPKISVVPVQPPKAAANR